MEQLLKNEFGETIYFELEDALIACSNYQWLIHNGFKFETPYGELSIDKVIPMRNCNGLYTPMILHDIFKPPTVPEYFEYKCPANYLISYLRDKKIPYFRYRAIPFSADLPH